MHDPGTSRGTATGWDDPPVAAFDPGWRVGFALVDADGRLLERGVLSLDEVAGLPLPERARVVVGSGTGRADLLSSLAARGLQAAVVDEEGTTLVARDLWRRDHPPQGLTRWVPVGLRPPPVAIDDYAAWAIALRYLGLEERDAVPLRRA